MSKNVIEAALITLPKNTHHGRIYDEQVFKEELKKWNIIIFQNDRKEKIKKILKLI